MSDQVDGSDMDEVSNPTISDLASRLDPEGMVSFTRAFVDDLRGGINAVDDQLFPWIRELRNHPWKGVLCLGMGGSAAGGDFLATLCSFEGEIPVIVHRDYTIPSWWDKDWLVLATSHSGNTEETLSAANIALKADATIVVISTGGELAGMCELYENCHLIPSVGGQPPRTAFGHIFSRQLSLLRQLGILPMPSAGSDEAMLDRLDKVVEGYDILHDEEGDINSLAMVMLDKPISILGPTEMMPALTRFKNQLNENSSRFARVGIIPEMNHNESVAWGGVGEYSDFSSQDHIVLLLAWNGMHRRVQGRIDWMIAHSPSDYAWKLMGEGPTLLEALLYHCIVMDWISLSLAFLHGKDPAAIGPITALKSFLDSIE